jgi:formylglycine-generating enzyme required for sulfatase activity
MGCGKSPPHRVDAPKHFSNCLGMKLILVPPGVFEMGAGNARPNPVSLEASPAHVVRITRPFYLSSHEVTQGQYKKLMAAHYSHPTPPFFSEDGGGKDLLEGLEVDRLPIDNATGTLAAEFCRRLSDLPEEKAAGRVYRLPTEAEWEYACRGGSTASFSYGNELSLSQANFNAPREDDGRAPLGRLAEVGSYPPNKFGFYDMHGNAWEWCNDGLRKYTTTSQKDPVGPGSLYRVLRGGAWDVPESYCRSDYRTEAISGYVFAGFRIACELKQ